MSKKSKSRVNATGRSDRAERFAMLTYSEIKHDAFRSLRGFSIKVYLELWSRFDGRNNGDLSLSLREGANLLYMSQSSVQRSIQDLIEKGFITMTSKGRWYGRKASTYSLTNKRLNGHLPAFAWWHWRKNKSRYSNSIIDAWKMIISWIIIGSRYRISSRQPQNSDSMVSCR